MVLLGNVPMFFFFFCCYLSHEVLSYIYKIAVRDGTPGPIEPRVVGVKQFDLFWFGLDLQINVSRSV